MSDNTCVVLIHGLARTPASLLSMEVGFRLAGFDVANISYPSTQHNIDELTNDYVWPKIKSMSEQGVTLHFVCHSLGGILIRNLVRLHPDLNIGKVVMLGPPNHGSELVDSFAQWPIFRLINGPAGIQLGTGCDSLPNNLGKASFELGIITGTKNYNPFFAAFFDGPHDGKVSVESTKLEGMTDFLTVNASHTFMMWNLDVIANSIHFVKTGKFIH